MLTRRQWITAAAALAARPALEASDRGGSPEVSHEITSAGFVDLQVNGFAGIDFNDPVTSGDQIAAAAAAMRATGVTSFLATVISAPLDRFSACARALARSAEPALAGIHMEGPYISPEDGARGAHRREDISLPSLEDFKRRQEAASGRIRLVTLAPEVAGATALIEHLVKDGVRVAIGHTNASPQQVRDAVAAGATMSTHLGNGCPQLLPRHPNFLWEQLAADRLMAGLIVDGHHLPAATVKAMVRAKTPARTILVTDAITAAGQPPGEYTLGSVVVRLDDTGRVAVPGQPNLAGSALSMDRAIGNTVAFTGLPFSEVLPMATTTPARYLGLAPRGTVRAQWTPSTSRLAVTRVTD